MLVKLKIFEPKNKIEKQKQGHTSDQKNDSKEVVAARAQGRYTTDDGYVF